MTLPSAGRGGSSSGDTSSDTNSGNDEPEPNGVSDVVSDDAPDAVPETPSHSSTSDDSIPDSGPDNVTADDALNDPGDTRPTQDAAEDVPEVVHAEFVPPAFDAVQATMSIPDAPALEPEPARDPSADAPEPPPQPSGSYADLYKPAQPSDVPASAPDPPSSSPARPRLARNQMSSPGALLFSPTPQQNDSLSLQQLRSIVSKLQRGGAGAGTGAGAGAGAADAAAAAYDYTHGDAGPLAEDLDEWFPVLPPSERAARLAATYHGFTMLWTDRPSSSGDAGWHGAGSAERDEFLAAAIKGIVAGQPDTLRAVTYVVLGDFVYNGSVHVNEMASSSKRHVATRWQLDEIADGVSRLARLGGVAVVWDAFVDALDRAWSRDATSPPMADSEPAADDELENLMTVLYVFMVVALNADAAELAPFRQVLLSLSPRPEIFLLLASAKLRWDENEVMPSTQMHLLLWRALLIVVGGTDDMARAKAATQELAAQSKDGTTITASPIDYHIFRQEITSKYPSYVPPTTLISLEPENCSLLPPLPNLPSRVGGGGIVQAAPPHLQTGASILHQPVHIVTPAPSPPPSPGVGKGTKKHNYQTNQNFPFLYPPMDATSNSAGGKGGAGLQEQLVGRRWEGGDVPASILEAGKLFSDRVRMTRGTRQLWDARETFLKCERGWDVAAEGDLFGSGTQPRRRSKKKKRRKDSAEGGEAASMPYLDEMTEEEQALILELDRRLGGGLDCESNEAEAGEYGDYDEYETGEDTEDQNRYIDLGPHGQQVDPDVQHRLEVVERLYLQSLVIVLLKVILANIGMLQRVGSHPAAAPRPTGPNGAGGGGGGAAQGPNRAAQARHERLNSVDVPEVPKMTPAEHRAFRAKEIGGKAVSGILLVLLKWFKISHILKFEFLTQLLVDSNYLPLVLKLLAHADVPQFVGKNIDGLSTSFFWTCNRLSENPRQIPRPDSPAGGPDQPAGELVEPSAANTKCSSDDDDFMDKDDAVPPPIKRRKSLPADSIGPRPTFSGGQLTDRPEVDELGVPINGLPAQPITDFSRRNFFALINYLRVLQKCCKDKAHRNLLLVQYKSANILRKSLKVPQDRLRLYTLKLFKNQVPYCGRKWRSSNMRVITAVYLHCRPELRDEWLAGSDVDAAIEASLPLEQALRSLTYWFNATRYDGAVAVAGGAGTGQGYAHDFFARELEKMQMAGWQEAGAEDDEDDDGGWEGQGQGHGQGHVMEHGSWQ